MPVSLQELLFAVEGVSMDGSLGQQQAFLCRQTGKIHWRYDEVSGLTDLNDKLPDDVDDDESYVAIPHKRDLGLGKQLALKFAREFLPNDLDEVRYMFSKRGAYARFRALLARRRAVDRWHDFEEKETERALREWCELNSIALAE
jgi:hypothetical protein